MNDLLHWGKIILNWLNWGYVLTIIGIIVATYLTLRNKKRISYEVIKKTALLTEREILENKIQILYEGCEVQDMTFIELRIINNGNLAISASDFERPLRIRFEEAIQIFSCEVLETNPSGIDLDIHSHKNEIEIMPLLINSGDNFLIKIIVSGREQNFIIDGRIKDVQKILKLQNYSGLFLTLSFIIVVIGGFLSSEKGKFFPWQRENFGAKEIIGFILIFVGYGLALYVIKKYKIKNNKDLEKNYSFNSLFKLLFK